MDINLLINGENYQTSLIPPHNLFCDKVKRTRSSLQGLLTRIILQTSIKPY